MSPLRSRFCEYMILRGFSPRTHESYLHAMLELARYYRRSPDQISNEEIQAFLVHVITVRRLAWSTVNVYFSAYRCFYEKILRWDRTDFHIPPRGRPHHRPFVLSRQAVKQILQATLNPPRRTLLAMVYGSGLRVSKVCCLWSRHIIESAPAQSHPFKPHSQNNRPLRRCSCPPMEGYPLCRSICACPASATVIYLRHTG